MSRIPGIDADLADDEIATVLRAQTKNYGSPLANHLVYARRPSLFKAVRGMWNAMDPDGRLGDGLVALINRHVARINECAF